MNVSQKIEDVVNELDFHKIRMVMEYTEWHWDGVGVPTQMEIYATAVELLTEAYESFNNTPFPNWVSTGGLRASCSLKDGEYQFRLVFELCDAGDEL